MVTVYHNLRLDPAEPETQDLELAGVVLHTNDLDEAFDRTIHRDGENWTDDPAVRFFGDRRSRRSSREGDVFVPGDGAAHLVLPTGSGFCRDSRCRFCEAFGTKVACAP